MKIELNGAALKAARNANGLSRDKLAVKLAENGLSVSTHTLATWENGKHTPTSIRLLGGIAALLGEPIANLITRSES
jgi:transcriptional regulator with XRE-family HTH domain